MAKICPGCQTQNIDGARFCRQCGAILPAQQAESQTRLNTAPVHNPYSIPNVPASATSVQSAPMYPTPDYGSVYQPYAPVPTAPLAGFWWRFLAHFIDGLFPIIIWGAAYGYVLGAAKNSGPDPAAMLLLLACGITHFAYILLNAYLQGTTGATIGKKLAGLKCLDNTGAPLGFWRSFLREIVKLLIGGSCFVFFLIDNLWMLGDPEKQTLHDKVVSSHVYKV